MIHLFFAMTSAGQPKSGQSHMKGSSAGKFMTGKRSGLDPNAAPEAVWQAACAVSVFLNTGSTGNAYLQG